MRLSLKFLFRGLFPLLVIGSLSFFFLLPDFVAGFMNKVVRAAPYNVDSGTRSIHDSLFVADLHADTLLWNRDPAIRGNYGHVDLPRLRDAGVALQIFSAVTKTPRHLNFESNDATTDNITALTIAQRWPSRTWFGLTERALHQAERLHAMSKMRGANFEVIVSQTDLRRLVAARERGEPLIGGILAIEGMHAAAGSMDNIQRLFDAGYRVMGLTHFFDNEIGGSAHGLEKGGLTHFGIRAISKLEHLGVTLDLAHASPRLIDEVLATVNRPVIVSHTGVRGTCDRTRNLSDTQIRAIAANGGLIGIAFFDEAVCATSVEAIIAAIVHVVELVGIEHVAFGSDFDGAVTTPFDVTGVVLLTQALLQTGFDHAQVRAIAGGNIIRILENNLPPTTAPKKLIEIK